MEIGEEECSSCGCESCGESKVRPFELDIHRVRSLNETYTRSGVSFGHMLYMVDSIIGIVTFEHVGSNIGREWTLREIHKFFQYHQHDGEDRSTYRFKPRRFDFKVYKIGKIRIPSTRSGRVFNHIMHIVDSIIGIITFGHLHSNFYFQCTSRDLDKLGEYIDRYGVDALRRHS